MDSKEFMRLSRLTEPSDEQYLEVQKRMCSIENTRLIHAMIGLETESGELLDNLKKHLFYGKELDKVNIREEVGDLFWYCCILLDCIGSDFDETMDINVKKLQARYGDKFTNEKALNRDLEKERKILEE